MTDRQAYTDRCDRKHYHRELRGRCNMMTVVRAIWKLHEFAWKEATESQLFVGQKSPNFARMYSDLSFFYKFFFSYLSVARFVSKLFRSYMWSSNHQYRQFYWPRIFTCIFKSDSPPDIVAKLHGWDRLVTSMWLKKMQRFSQVGQNSRVISSVCEQKFTKFWRKNIGSLS